MGVFIDSFTQGHVQGIHVLGGILGAGRDDIDDGEGERVHAALQGTEGRSHRLGKLSQTQQAVLADHGTEEVLVDLHELYDESEPVR